MLHVTRVFGLATFFALGIAGSTMAQTPVLYRDFVTGTTGSSINFTGHHLIEVNGRIVFGAKSDDNTSEESLFAIDGTSTVLLPVSGGYFDPREMVVFDDKLYVWSASDMYVTDGTVSGTSLLCTIPSTLNAPQDMCVYDDKIYFHDVNGVLGVLDPVAATITAISDSITNISEVCPTAIGLFVNGRSPSKGLELLKLNSAGTALELVKDILPGSSGSGPSALRAAGNSLFFCARNPGNTMYNTWLSDGTESGTQIINTAWDPYNDNSAEAIRREQFITYGGKAYFNAENGAGQIPLYVTDGTVSGTVPVDGGMPTGPASWMIPAENYIYFYFGGTAGWWQYDPVAETAIDMPDTVYLPETQASNTFGYIGGNAVGDSLLFIGSKAGTGAEPFMYAASGAVHMLGDVNPGAADAGYNYCNFAQAGGGIYFSLQDADHGIELWCIGCTPDTGEINGLTERSSAQALPLIAFPNPASDAVQLKLDQSGGFYMVYDIRGTVVRTDAITSNNPMIHLGELPTGSYVLRVIQGGSDRHVRILKQ